MAGTAVSRRDYKTVTASGYPLIKDQDSYADLDYISTQANSKVGGTTLTDTKLSYFARINYDYENKYLFQATVRRTLPVFLSFRRIIVGVRSLLYQRVG